MAYETNENQHESTELVSEDLEQVAGGAGLQKIYQVQCNACHYSGRISRSSQPTRCPKCNSTNVRVGQGVVAPRH